MVLEAKVLDYEGLKVLLNGSREELSLSKQLTIGFDIHDVVNLLTDIHTNYMAIERGKTPYIELGRVKLYDLAWENFKRLRPRWLAKHLNLVSLFEEQELPTIKHYVAKQIHEEHISNTSLEDELKNYNFIELFNFSLFRDFIKSFHETSNIPKEIRLLKEGEDRDYGAFYKVYKIEKGQTPALKGHTLEVKTNYEGLIRRLETLMETNKPRRLDIRILYDKNAALFQVYIK